MLDGIVFRESVVSGWVTGMDRHKGCCGLEDRRKRGRDGLATIVKW